ncbi:MAG TPA: hypothetical protein VEX86_24185 [Longimicrobium sp.]|nr:hypothetical protein [Longimicrobium sp.]
MHYPARVYDELVDFIAANTAPEKLIAFHPSENARRRVADLIFREKNDRLSSEETSELNYYMLLEHVMRLAKAKAHGHLGEPRVR